AQRPRPGHAAQPGDVLAADHRHPGRPGGAGRADHRQHRHRAHEAGEPAHRGDRHGAGRRGFPAGVRLVRRRRPGSGRELRLGPARVPRRADHRRQRLRQGHGVPARPGGGAHLLPPRPARGPPAPVPAPVRRQDDPGRRGAARPAVRRRRAGAAALAARLGRARQRPGRTAGVLAVRQPDPARPAVRRRLRRRGHVAARRARGRASGCVGRLQRPSARPRRRSRGIDRGRGARIHVPSTVPSEMSEQSSSTDSAEAFRKAALDYHRLEPRGKIRVTATKPMLTQRDLALAYSPGVAYACEEIAADPTKASDYTARGNLVAVISNGTAVLGLGDIGPLAGKPVMEGKGVLFQRFAGIDAFDIEIDERDPDKLVEIIASLEPTFGGINLEDIKAPECFIVERKLRERLQIPVFHDDQHGTAIIVGAAVVNALEIAGKDIADVKVATTGAGAAGIACLDMLVALGLKPENITAFDRGGVIHTGRTDLDEAKQRYARDTDQRELAQIVAGADIFLGLSAGGILKPEMVATMAERPIILALANPYPEILPDDAKAVRPDAIIATGRSDFPNQVNNALCFPYIFRGALDVGATGINEAMKLACV